jgi:hypothetical protein
LKSEVLYFVTRQEWEKPHLPEAGVSRQKPESSAVTAKEPGVVAKRESPAMIAGLPSKPGKSTAETIEVT